jgi:hypothetical protein
MPLSEKQKIGAVILEDLLASGTIRSCVNCEGLTKQGCSVAQQMPPPEVIMKGCDAWDQKIPF